MKMGQYYVHHPLEDNPQGETDEGRKPGGRIYIPS
jgi:hypothetical protein